MPSASAPERRSATARFGAPSTRGFAGCGRAAKPLEGVVSERAQACGEGFGPTSRTGHVVGWKADELGDLLGPVCARYEVDHTVCAPPPTRSLLTSLLTGPSTNHGTREDQVCDLGFYRGAKENRTPDLFHAMEALYQLSYSPECVRRGRGRLSTDAPPSQRLSIVVRPRPDRLHILTVSRAWRWRARRWRVPTRFGVHPCRAARSRRTRAPSRGTRGPRRRRSR